MELNSLVGVNTGQVFPIRDGIPIILDRPSFSSRNQFYRRFYDLTAFTYDIVLAWGAKLNAAQDDHVRQEYIQKLPISPGDKVLESAVGTASNILQLPDHAQYYGVDISLQMLRIGNKKLAKQGRSAEMFNCDGAYLPFHDDTFDLSFQMGGLQFFADPFRGVSEMARVTRSGGKIIIIDEISGAIRTLKRLPAHAKYAKDKHTAVEAISRLVPKSMANIESVQIGNQAFYALTFTKPNKAIKNAS